MSAWRPGEAVAVAGRRARSQVAGATVVGAGPATAQKKTALRMQGGQNL